MCAFSNFNFEFDLKTIKFYQLKCVPIIFNDTYLVFLDGMQANVPKRNSEKK